MKNTFVVIALMSIVIAGKAQITDTSYFHVDNVKIHTVLSVPKKVQAPPLAIILAGSGPTDLNGNQPAMQNNSLKFLSDALVANNIATFRFDKRGIAKSNFNEFSESDLSVDLYASDAMGLIRYCKQKGFNDIYVIGHSEGSLIGLISAQDIKIKGFISLCGAGNPADIILKKQLKPKLPPAFYNQVELIIDSLKNEQTVKSVPPQLYALFRPSIQPYLTSWFKYEPTNLIHQLNCPTLIIQGGKDIQVDLEESELLNNGTSKGKLVIIDNMNHVLKTISGDIQENIASYSNPNLPVNGELIESIVDFIN